MIKAEDKVICIKEYETVYASLKVNYIEGFTYEVLRISETTGRAYINCKSFYKGLGSFFHINGDSFRLVSNSPLFSDYFIPFAEWREQQIKSILDD